MRNLKDQVLGFGKNSIQILIDDKTNLNSEISEWNLKALNSIDIVSIDESNKEKIFHILLKFSNEDKLALIVNQKELLYIQEVRQQNNLIGGMSTRLLTIEEKKSIISCRKMTEKLNLLNGIVLGAFAVGILMLMEFSAFYIILLYVSIVLAVSLYVMTKSDKSYLNADEKM